MSGKAFRLCTCCGRHLKAHRGKRKACASCSQLAERALKDARRCRRARLTESLKDRSL